MTVKATVRSGRLVVDEPTTLPHGTEVELLPLDPGDWLSSPPVDWFRNVNTPGDYERLTHSTLPLEQKAVIQ